MNPRRDFVVALLVLALTALACANPLSPPTETPVPTDTPEPTETPTPTPTATPTVTPTPTPIPIEDVDLSGVTLTADDMPEGYLAAETGSSESPIGELVPANQFSFQLIDMQSGDFHFVTGFVAPVTSDSDQAQLDELFQDPAALEAFMNEEMGSSDFPIASQEPLADIADIGDQRAGTVASGSIQEISVKLEVLVFERGRIAIILASLYTETMTPELSIQEMGRTLDQRAQEALTMP